MYVKIQIVGQVVSYYVSATSEFSEKPTKSETLSGIDTKTVGFLQQKEQQQHFQM